jgi:HipA-like protein
MNGAKNSKKRQRLKVSMNGILVGCLEYLSAGGMRFFYEKTWLSRMDARPLPLSLPLRETI